jgi:hypothetical protein
MGRRSWPHLALQVGDVAHGIAALGLGRLPLFLLLLVLSMPTPSINQRHVPFDEKAVSPRMSRSSICAGAV